MVAGQRTIQFVMGPNPRLGVPGQAAPAPGVQRPQTAAVPIQAHKPVKAPPPTPAELDAANAASAAKSCSPAAHLPPAVSGRGGGGAPLAGADNTWPDQERGRPKELTGLRARGRSERSYRARSSSRQSHARCDHCPKPDSGTFARANHLTIVTTQSTLPSHMCVVTER